MNEQGAFIADLLDASRKAWAAGAVLRLQERGPEARRLVETWGFEAVVSDLQLRVQHLAEALAAGRPELFLLDVDWLRATYAAREVSQDLIEQTLACLRDELAEGLPPDAVKMVAGFMDQALARLAGPARAPASHLEGEDPHVDVARRFVESLLEGDRRKAERIVLDAREAGVTVSDLHLSVITRAQEEIGRMWQSGEARVTDEHFGSRVVEDVLARLRSSLPEAEPTGRKVLAASVAGNLHDIGARIVSDHFEMSGWRTTFLGANVPAEDLVQAARDLKPDLVALSVGLITHVRATADTVAALRRAVPGLPILVGGGPFALVDDLWKDVGADGCARDASEAVRVGTELVGAV